MANDLMSRMQAHPYHLVSPSPWPASLSLALLALAFGGSLSIQSYTLSALMLVMGFSGTMSSMCLWFSDMMTEGTYLGNHTLAVQSGLSMGIGLFMVSEALFFLAMFWAFFHSALSPTMELGAKWPPMGMEAVNPFELPLLNTVLLLSSGVTVTFAHHSLMQGNSSGGLRGSIYTMMLALVFTAFQALEYSVSSFTISDGTYTSCFYFGTGFHGLHVMMGTAFLIVCYWRFRSYQLTQNHHLGFESAMVYWHFVDMVWLILFMSVYYWGS